MSCKITRALTNKVECSVQGEDCFLRRYMYSVRVAHMCSHYACTYVDMHLTCLNFAINAHLIVT